MKAPACFLAAALMIPAIPTRAADPAAAAAASNALGLRILDALPADAPNRCLSPYSIASALAMTYAGSAGETRSQMASALGFPKDPDPLASSFHALDAALQKAAEVPDVTLERANRLFGQRGFAFRKPFLDLLEDQFDAPLDPIDFRADPPAAAGLINLWIAKQTKEKIQYLIPSNAISEATTLVLVNALYLQSPWQEPFDPAQTAQMPFEVPGGEGRKAATMQSTQKLGYGKLDGAVAVSIPYRGGELQLLVLLPDKDLASWRPKLTPDLLASCAKLEPQPVRLFLPKFLLEPPTLALADILKQFGMKSAFDQPRGSADFDAMAPRRPNDYLFLSDVFHKTFLDLDEKGTEAAAATAVVMLRATAMPAPAPEPVEVRVDRPFFFAIQHVETGACLFLGKITDPEAG